MKRKVKLLSPHDVNEVVRFRQYLDDLWSEMSFEEFADKWAEYMGIDKLEAATHCKQSRERRKS